jgi:hypothetical protein
VKNGLIHQIANEYVELTVSYIKTNYPKDQFIRTIDNVISRKGAVRMAKLANFSVCGTKVSDVLNETELIELIEITYKMFLNAKNVDVATSNNKQLAEAMKASITK